MVWRQYYMQARSPFHLGERGVGLEGVSVLCHADTLFSALCHGLRELEGAGTLQEMLATYETDNPALVITSAFPYLTTAGQAERVALDRKSVV